MIVYFDIETIPTTDQKIIDEIKDSIKPPGSIKKQESIDKWLTENLESELKKKVEKTALDGLYGSIACIAYALNDGEVNHISSYDNPEVDLLTEFYEMLAFEIDNAKLQFCGHNICDFDLPFLKHRSIINNVAPPPDLQQAMNSKPWDDSILDTMLMWSRDKSKMVSMKKLCYALGIEYEDEINGSMVAEYWETEPDKVIDHCIADVKKVRDIYKRLTWSE